MECVCIIICFELVKLIWPAILSLLIEITWVSFLWSTILFVVYYVIHRWPSMHDTLWWCSTKDRRDLLARTFKKRKTHAQRTDFRNRFIYSTLLIKSYAYNIDTRQRIYHTYLSILYVYINYCLDLMNINVFSEIKQVRTHGQTYTASDFHFLCLPVYTVHA